MTDNEIITALESRVKELESKVELLATAISRYGFAAPEIVAPQIDIIQRISDLE